ncbi:MAG: NAD-glutamate dehydrogenase domain-containing protein [bacterium]
MADYEVYPLKDDRDIEQPSLIFEKAQELMEENYEEPLLSQLKNLSEIVRQRLNPDFFSHYSPRDYLGFLEFIQDEIETKESNSTFRLNLLNEAPGNQKWSTPFTVINLVGKNLPFIVDSIYEFLKDNNYNINYLFYDPVYVEKENGKLKKISREKFEGSRKLYLVNFQLEKLPKNQLTELEEEINEILTDIELAVNDFDQILEKVNNIQQLLEDFKSILPDNQEILDETSSFLDFLVDNHFVFLGFREYNIFRENDSYQLETVEDSNLGVLKRESEFPNYPTPTDVENVDRRLHERITSSIILTVKKTEVESRVYRREQLDHITIKKLDKDGNISGEYQFLGLFTDKTLALPAVDIPLLQKKFKDLIEREGIEEHTHLYRDVYAAYNNMPKPLLFMSTVEDLIQDIRAIVEAYGESEFNLRARPDIYHQGLAIMLLMTRQRYNDQIKDKIRHELEEEFEPEAMDHTLTMGESNLVQLHFYLQTDRRNPRTCSFEELEQRLHELSRTWEDHLQELIFENYSAKEAREISKLYKNCFPAEYRALISPRLALNDIKNLQLIQKDTPAPYLDLINIENTETENLIIYSREKIKLNNIMPPLSNHGLEISEQSTFNIELEDEEYYLHLFQIESSREEAIDFKTKKELLQDSILGVLKGRYRNDILNNLVTSQGLSPRALNLFRLYKNYFHQINPAIKLESINRALVNHPEISNALFEYFTKKFNPQLELADREQEIKNVKNNIMEMLDEIPDRNIDNILRSLLNQMVATTRTNYYQQNCEKEYISVKIKCELIDEMPAPRPYFEIYVYSPFMEAIHLRGGELARGGIRWSDRRDDFRTEVLDLMKTQMVKNTLIVPQGAKGGFILKPEHLGEGELKEQAREQYKIFMQGLLDLTDNRKDGQVIRPDDVIAYDKDDPYMVVAADKGTGHLSDTANSISRDYNFWLGDAFASGGSVGYDHKELGITAKGAWECVERHFREMGVNIEEETFTCAGIGDMGGDVFGNGMLLSENIELKAAFNHRHIFIDPEPDPDKSFQERKRLYENVLGWDEYNSELISEGGGVYKREAKTIDLSDSAREMLEIEKEKPDGEEVISAILRADVHLLWNGGIGTYIKGSNEANSEVGDPANDECRVEADEVRADVIGEGGNLGITQKGRIELANNDVRLNTDALDNSGGVDLSDHEVNIKILLQEAIKEDELDPEEREDFLESLTDSLIKDVREHNYRQSGAISLEHEHSTMHMEDYRNILNHLEETVGLDREVEELPGEREMQERIKAGQGLTRPELAVLLSYTKMDLYNQAKEYDWDEEWVTEDFLRRYFPEGIPEKLSQGLQNHPLRSEIAATTLVNHAVDNTGIIFFYRLEEELGANAPEIINWFLAVDRLVDGPEFRKMIFDLDGEIPAENQYKTWRELRGTMEDTIYWLFNALKPEYSPARFCEIYKPLLDKKFAGMIEHFGEQRQKRMDEKLQSWHDKGLDEEFDPGLVRLNYLVPALDILLVHQQTNYPIENVSDIYFELGTELHIDWLMSRIASARPDRRWDQFAFRSMSIELNTIQRYLTAHLLEHEISPDEFIADNSEIIDRLERVYAELRRDMRADLSGYQFMVQRIKRLNPHN